MGFWVMVRVAGAPGRLGKVSQAHQCPQSHGNLFYIEKKIIFNTPLHNDALVFSNRALSVSV